RTRDGRLGDGLLRYGNRSPADVFGLKTSALKRLPFSGSGDYRLAPAAHKRFAKLDNLSGRVFVCGAARGQIAGREAGQPAGAGATGALRRGLGARDPRALSAVATRRGTDPASSRALASCTARPLGPSRKRGILREPCARNTLMSAAPTWGPDIMANATVE